ncbi:unnamed protein product [Urochloa decumbens]|uniref:AAA+ ATPase domain-containing protein n=1 Tax=Urochloa decumbens TaxID=240449 RepID=A0ABC9GDT0_9POAL
MMAAMKEWVTDGVRATGWVGWATLLAYYGPRGLPKMYLKKHLRRYARRLLFLDPMVTIDIIDSNSSMYGQPNIVVEEAMAYITKACSRDVLEFSAKGTGVQGRSLLLSLGEGQEVSDHFEGVTVWWLLVPRGSSSGESRLRLMFPQRHRALILDEYLPHVRRQGRQDMLGTIDIIDTSSPTNRIGDEFNPNYAFKEVNAYVTKLCSRDALDLRAEGTVHDDSFLLSLRNGGAVADRFRDVTVWWWLSLSEPTTNDNSKQKILRLMFPQRHRALILEEYLPHVRRTGREDLFISIDIISKPAFIPGDDDAYKEVKAYLSSACSGDALDLRAESVVKDDRFLLSLRDGEEVSDRFRDVTLRWLSVPLPSTKKSNDDRGCLRLMFPKQHRVLILDEYLPHVRQQGRNLISRNRRQGLYTNKQKSTGYRGDMEWSRIIDFEHPATFDTLAMCPTKKRKIMEDLDSFRGNEGYYRRIGKPWKRGYLLFGPPGTGKSTMIAAMGNYLNYDIYDMELTSVSNNSNLRNLLTKITSKSIIVIEDIDCCFEDFNGQRMNNQGMIISSGYKGKEKVTMSGLLNFIDGVWSAQSGERIIVLTTNFPDKLDAALTRSGRMDMHIEMSYCCFESFKTLARNYLGIGAHPMFQRVEELLQVVEITPADVAECLLIKADVPAAGFDRGVEACLRRLIDELDKKAQEKEAAAKPKRQRRR